jgi:hypothetical protein
VAILSDAPNGVTGVLSGTSMAAAHASGALALLVEAQPNANARMLETTLHNTGTIVVDPRTRRIVPRIDAFAALTTISGKPFTPLVHLHGVLFTCWTLFFIGQTSLVASGRVAVHRRTGIAGVALAAAMIVAGVSLAIMSAARGTAPPGIDPLSFLAVPLFDMVLFATFVTLAISKRRDREAHKRLMLMAYVSLLAAPIARIPGVLPLGPLGYFGLAFLFVVVGAIYDRVSRGRIHRVYLWGGALFALSVPARLLLSSTAAWKSFAKFLTS